jgi:hypothetical protein
VSGPNYKGLWIIGGDRKMAYARKELSAVKRYKVIEAMIESGPPKPNPECVEIEP